MTPKPLLPLLVFTDLDGTLLDHHSYDYQPALPSLQQLSQQQVPVIFNSSKTAIEMQPLRQALALETPFIAENGSAIHLPLHYFDPQQAASTQQFEVKHWGQDSSAIVDLVTQLRQSHGYRFNHFAAMSTAQVAECTGLSHDAAHLAKQRHASEPILWQDDEQALADFKQQIEAHQLRLIKGGRFYHVLGPTDKARAMTWLVERYSDYHQMTFTSVALGDGEHDRAMLEAADIPIVIQAANGQSLQLNNNKTLYTHRQGPSGWQWGINAVLMEIAHG